MCDRVKRKDPHAIRKINDVTTELLSLGEGSGTIVAIMPERDKNHNTILRTENILSLILIKIKLKIA